MSSAPNDPPASSSVSASTTLNGEPQVDAFALEGADLNADHDLIHWEASARFPTSIPLRLIMVFDCHQPNDSGNPFNFPTWKKGVICAVVYARLGSCFDALVLNLSTDRFILLG